MNERMTSGSVLKSILTILAGIVLVAWSDIAVNYAVIIIGILILLSGGVSIMMYYKAKRAEAPSAWFMVLGVLSLVLGTLLIVMPTFFVNILMIILGVIIIIAALDQFSELALYKRLGAKVPVYYYTFPTLIIISGVVVLLNPFSTASTLVIFFGSVVIAYGIIGLVNLLTLRKSGE